VSAAQGLQGGELIALNPHTLALGKMVGGIALIGLVLWIFGAEQVGTMLLYMFFPIMLIVAGVAMATGGSLELWNFTAMKEGFKQGVKDASAKPLTPPVGEEI
jgi:hypothetical protein